jgi:glycosyltransferase involved in cell wall biosynthesis
LYQNSDFLQEKCPDSIEARRAISSAAEPLSAEEIHAFHPPRAGMTTLSLAMIVRNEGQTIERVLDCAKAFADEMVVVDTGSTDDTIAKAKAKGAKVHYFSWIDDFAAARNYSFSKCAGDWIIWLDGDDVISPDNQKRILDLKRTVLNDELEAVYLRYLYPPFRQWRESTSTMGRPTIAASISTRSNVCTVS